MRDALVLVLQPPPIRGLSQTGGFELMIEDRAGKGVAAMQQVVDRFQDEARKRPELAGVFSTFSARVPQLKFDLDRTKARRLDVPVSDVFAVLQANLGGYYVNDFDLYGKVWKVMVQAEGGVRKKPRGHREPLRAEPPGQPRAAQLAGRGPLRPRPDRRAALQSLRHRQDQRRPAPGYSSGQALAAMEEVAARVLPRGFGFEWTGTTLQEQKTGNQAASIFALSVVCVFLFMAALYESWVRPLVIILTVPLATFGAVFGLWLYDMPLDVFGQIGLVMLIGLETKNAILIVEFGVEMREKRGMGIVESAKAASRERLRPILMTSFAFVMGVLPMARAIGAGAYSRNSLGIVIAFGIAVSTVLGRFVIPIYYVLGERIIDALARRRRDAEDGDEHADDSDRVDATAQPQEAGVRSGRWRERALAVPSSLHQDGIPSPGGLSRNLFRSELSTIFRKDHDHEGPSRTDHRRARGHRPRHCPGLRSRRGPRLVISGRRDQEGRKLLADIRELGVEAEYVRTDVRHEDDVRGLIDQTVARFGRLDVAVNNAGTEGQPGPITEQSAESYAAVFDTNVLGVLLCMKHELRVMLPQRRGSIVNVSSVAGHRGFAGASVYVASKHAVEGLTKSAALEAAASGVRVNIVAPGPIETGMLDRFTGTEENKAGLIARVPLGRAGGPEEVAQAIVFLSTDKASFTTGATFAVDGGIMAQ